MRKNPESKQRVEVQLPEPLVMEASLFLRRNALTGRVAHGEWSTYIERHVRQDLVQRASRVQDTQGE